MASDKAYNKIENIVMERVFSLENENEQLKKELELAKAKEEATALGIKFNPNIGLEKLLERIEEAKK